MLKRLTLHHVFTKEGKICVHPYYNLSKEVEQKSNSSLDTLYSLANKVFDPST